MFLRLVSAVLAAMLAWGGSAPLARAVELIMVEQQGCEYCIEWKEVLGPIYPKTPEGAYAPLRMIDVSQAPPEGVTFARHVNFTPTFVLVENGTELARIEGYPGEDFFWGLLGMMLEQNTDFALPVQTN